MMQEKMLPEFQRGAFTQNGCPRLDEVLTYILHILGGRCSMIASRRQQGLLLLPGYLFFLAKNRALAAAMASAFFCNDSASGLLSPDASRLPL